jgi:beta-xylosidase
MLHAIFSLTSISCRTLCQFVLFPNQLRLTLSISLAYENHILPGSYPDPCVLRVDDTFYVINSSFQFFQGCRFTSARISSTGNL